MKTQLKSKKVQLDASAGNHYLSYFSEGMPSPGKFTCGAVRRVTVKDYVKREGKESVEVLVDLMQTAKRGLEEDLRVELIGDDIKALCLTTVYLKFDLSLIHI